MRLTQIKCIFKWMLVAITALIFVFFLFEILLFLPMQKAEVVPLPPKGNWYIPTIFLSEIENVGRLENTGALTNGNDVSEKENAASYVKTLFLPELVQVRQHQYSPSFQWPSSGEVYDPMLYSHYIEFRFAFLQKHLLNQIRKRFTTVFFQNVQPQPIEDDRFDVAYIMRAPLGQSVPPGVFIAAVKGKRIFCVQYCFGLVEEAEIIDAVARVLAHE